MRIINIRVLRGPNYWSNYRKQLIHMKLDIGKYEQLPTDKIPGFCDRLKSLLPSMHDHECSEEKPGGFFERVKTGTWLGHVVEHVALELQSLAGMECGYGRTRSTSENGVYHVVFAYEVEQAGIYAAKAAVGLVGALAEDNRYDLCETIGELKRIKRYDGLGPSAQAIVDEAAKKDIPWRRLDDRSLILLGQGKNQQLVRAAMTSATSSIAVDLAGDKEDTKKLLVREFIPVPKGITIKTEQGLEEAIEEFGYPLVIKPVSGNHGRGITINIHDKEKALEAFNLAKKISPYVVVEKFIDGADFRFLVINYKLVAVAKRMPAFVIGDGHSTVEQLIDELNNDPKRGDGHEKVLTTVKIDATTLSVLHQNGYELDTIPEPGDLVFLKDTANISTGGTSRNVLHQVHPYNVFLAERIARLMNLDICGIDIMAKDINMPLTEENGAVLEVNAAPGLRMHLSPSKGLPQNVAAPIIDMLYPNNAPSRIPLVAVTGTNGKTTTVRLIAHIAKQAGHTVGFNTTDGIYINDNLVTAGDCSGPVSAATVLRDPIVDFAVLECARGGILRSGLGFDKCNTSIITNITEDHLGLDEIDSLEEMAKVKAVVASSTFPNGYAILNADDDRVYKIRKELDCRIALFSMDENNERVKQHVESGGTAALIEKGYFTIFHDGGATRIAKVKEVPLTLEARAECMIKNILPSILAAYVQGISVPVIQQALLTFVPSPENTPGRMNIFRFRRFQVMLDYAHNKDGFSHLKKFMDQTEASAKVGIIASPGDRRDEDIREIGRYAAQIFDRIIIRHDNDGRGRTNEELTRLLREGINTINEHVPVTIISDEIEAIQYAMDMATDGSFIVICSDKVQQTKEFLTRAKEYDDSFIHINNNPVL